PGVVSGDRPSRPLLLRFVVAGEIGAHGGPGLPPVRGPEQDVGAVIDDLRVVRRDRDGSGPLKTIAIVLRAVTGQVLGIDRHVPGHAGPVVVPGADPEVFAGIDDARVGWIRRGPSSLAASDVVPVGIGDAAGVQAVARTRGGPEVLYGPR